MLSLIELVRIAEAEKNGYINDVLDILVKAGHKEEKQEDEILLGSSI